MKVQHNLPMYLLRFLHAVYRVRSFCLVLLIVLLSLFVLIQNLPDSADIRLCFEEHSINSEANRDHLGLHRLEDILVAKRKPTAGKSIFFHETSCNLQSKSNVAAVFDSFGSVVRSKGAQSTTPAPLPHGVNTVSLNSRQACAIESAALHNPNFDVFVLFASAGYLDNSTAHPVLDAVLSYANIHLRKLNLWSYAAETPLQEWLKSGKLFKSKYVLSHISDFLRYLTLWRWGGTYLDLDVIVKRTFEDVPPNFTGAESATAIAAGVMNFAADGFGHEIAEQCLRDLQHNFDGSLWGNNGPGVITRVMQNVCHTRNIAIMTRERCMGFNVYPKETFYAIPWTLWEHFFEAQYLEETLKETEHSFVAHFWNALSTRRRIKVGSNVAYGKLAEVHCPKVYAASGEFF